MKNGYVRSKYDDSIPHLYGQAPCKIIVEKIQSKTRPFHSHECGISPIKNYKLHKALLLHVLKAIENGTLQESDLTINHTSKLKTATFNESSATDPNNPNITYRYDASSPYDQTFVPNNFACIVTAVKSPFSNGIREYLVYEGNVHKITSQERLDALKNDIACYIDDQENEIIGERQNPRESLSLEQQLKLAQEELDISTLDFIEFDNIEDGSSFLHDSLLLYIFEQHYQQEQEVTRLKHKLLQQQLNLKKYFAFQQHVNEQKKNEIQQEKARIKVQSNIQSIVKHNNNHCDCCTIS